MKRPDPTTIPTPPEEIRGKLAKWMPDALKEKRFGYIRCCRDLGYYDKDIAVALGLTQGALSDLIRRNNMHRVVYNYQKSMEVRKAEARKRLARALNGALDLLGAEETYNLTSSVTIKWVDDNRTRK